MAKKVEHLVNVKVVDGLCEGEMRIEHGSLKHNSESLGTSLHWFCDVTGVAIDDLLKEAARNISVRMAGIREFDYKEFVEKRGNLDGATVAYGDIATWTTRGTKGRKKVSEMSTEELLKILTPEQIAAILATAKTE